MATGGPDDVMIAVRDVAKRYGDIVALDGVDLSVREGEAFGVLGPNGAGKTTLFKILTTVTEPTGGTARIAGFDVRTDQHEVRERIGYIPQQTAVDDFQTGRQLLELFAKFYAVPAGELRDRCEAALDVVDLNGAADRKIETYSGGMKRRLEIACALVQDASVVLLDEPTLGLDPSLRYELWEYIRRIQSRGTTLLIATHNLEEADALCDRLAVLDDGEVVTVDEPEAMKRRVADAGDRSLGEAFRTIMRERQSTGELPPVASEPPSTDD